MTKIEQIIAAVTKEAEEQGRFLALITVRYEGEVEVTFGDGTKQTFTQENLLETGALTMSDRL